MAFFGMASASLTTPGPPVTSSTGTSGWAISRFAESRVGSAIAVMRSGGPPAVMMARLRTWMFSTETSLAFGCTLNVTALPAEIIAIELLINVDVGFVTGEIEPITPYGANSLIHI